ncbi:MAG: DUF4174 domain-containing protein [Armatimonadota bacterium]
MNRTSGNVLVSMICWAALAFSMAYNTPLTPVYAADTTPPSNLNAYRNRNRVLLVFSPSAGDVRYKKQNEFFNDKENGLKDRDLVRINVIGKPDSALRKRYAVGCGDFRVLLIGKDGHTAFSTTRPVVASDLFRRIDRMPMRRDEMRQRGQ